MTVKELLERREDGLELTLLVRPGARKRELVGPRPLADGVTALALRVPEPPREGRANEAALRFVAELFGVPRRAVRLLSGATSRIKRVFVLGDPEALAERFRLSAAQDDG